MFKAYSSKLINLLESFDWSPVEQLAVSLSKARRAEKNVFICGNGGSAANAIHIANDLIFGASKNSKKPLKAKSLIENQSVLTCLANDLTYKEVFAYQLSVYGQSDDILIALSGSGNSPNIITALIQAAKMDIQTCAILGFDGGKAIELANNVIHFPICDMQITEDCQEIVGHMLMKYLVSEDKR